jgi:glyoxylase-like metal-dependent hydrolase (beta-lactamase superfamily II)
MGILTVTKINDGLWQFCENLRENHSVDAYLVTGSERALFIDALQDVTGVYPEIKKITPLPVDCIILHGHGDHDGPACREIKDAGGAVYIHPGDIPLAMGERGDRFPQSFFTPIEGGAKIDLGGAELEIFLLPGHTPGSLAAFDRRRHWLFSSDTVGSGPLWVQLPHSMPLHEVRDNLKAFYEGIKQYGDLLIYPGHRYQSPGQIGLPYIADTLETIELILAGKVQGEKMDIPFRIQDQDTVWLSVRHKGSLGLVYNPANL